MKKTIFIVLFLFVFSASGEDSSTAQDRFIIAPKLLGNELKHLNSYKRSQLTSDGDDHLKNRG